jgi:hypothetical protein
MVFATWIGLLWAVSPALACGQGAHRDCCPPGVTTPCGGSGVDLGSLAALCCATAPSAPSAMAADASRTIEIQKHHAELLSAIAPGLRFGKFNHPPPIRPGDHVSAPNDAGLTYLLTLRLRL